MPDYHHTILLSSLSLPLHHPLPIRFSPDSLFYRQPSHHPLAHPHLMTESKSHNRREGGSRATLETETCRLSMKGRERNPLSSLKACTETSVTILEIAGSLLSCETNGTVLVIILNLITMSSQFIALKIFPIAFMFLCIAIASPELFFHHLAMPLSNNNSIFLVWLFVCLSLPNCIIFLILLFLAYFPLTI